MKNHIFFLFLFIGSMHAQKQSALYDSINKYQLSNSLLAKQYSFKLLKFSKENDLINGECNAYFFLADIYTTLDNKDSVFYYYDKAIQKANEKGRDNLVLIYKINKANYFFCQFDYESSLVTYNDCLELAEKLGDDILYQYILFKRGCIDYEMGKYNQALKVFQKSIRNKDFEPTIKLETKLCIARTYMKLKQPGQALLYINSGIKEAKSFKSIIMQIDFLVEKALYFMANKKFSESEKVLKEAEILLSKTNDPSVIFHVGVNKAKLFILEEKNKAAIDVLEELLEKGKLKTIPIEYLVEIYYLLAESYRITDNAVLSNEFYQKFIIESKKIGQKKIETIDYLHNINVSEIENEKKTLSYQKWGLTIALSVLSLLLVVLYFRKKKKEQENQEKFDHLMRRINEFEAGLNVEKETPIEEELHIARNHIADIEETTEEEVSFEGTFEGEMEEENIEEMDSEPESYDEEMLASGATGFIIKDEKVNQILDGLVRLEEKKYFLKQECTLHTVAKKLKTNTAYLSKIVNNELGKSFSTYINELRINYIIVELKNNARLRSYSVNAIAVEIGYKRPDAFTRYFKEATGITPTIYIKKINQHLESNK